MGQSKLPTIVRAYVGQGDSSGDQSKANRAPSVALTEPDPLLSFPGSLLTQSRREVADISDLDMARCNVRLPRVFIYI